MDKLDSREKECLQLKGSAKITPVVGIKPVLSFPGNDKVTFLANCIELQKNSQYGQHVVTVTDLKPGDVVAVEEAFCSTLHHEFKYERCENCLKEHNYSLVPCKHCVSVMFCGDECRDEAYEKFHKIECPITDYIAKLLCKDSVITLRTVISAITSFNTVDELVTFIDETENEDSTMRVFSCNYKEKSHNSYVPVHFTADNFDVTTEFAAFILVSLISQPLLELTELKEKFTTAKAVTVLKELILHHIERVPINHSAAIYFNGSLFEEYARGLYPFRSLLNHSCVPNLMMSSSDNKLVYTVSKPIKAGEQLFDNYK